MSHIKTLSFILYNYSYQIKKAIRLKKFSLSILEYLWKYIYVNKKEGFNLLIEELPWITFQAFDFICSILKKEFIVYEFGSGGSSLFLSKRVKEVHSVEHDFVWLNQLKEVLKVKEPKFFNLHINLIPPTLKSDFTKVVSLSDQRFKNCDFEEYANSILYFPDEYFDLIIIDGRARPYCLKNSLSKLKRGGYLLFDNSDRIHYQEGLNIIRNWQVLESYGPTIGDLSFNQTSIYRKPLN